MYDHRNRRARDCTQTKQISIRDIVQAHLFTLVIRDGAVDECSPPDVICCEGALASTGGLHAYC
jgi:hypothetical protein